MKTNNMLRKIIATLAVAALILTGSAPYFAFAEPLDGSQEGEFMPSATFDDSRVPAVSGHSVILMNAENGDVIYEKNARQNVEPASVTKILNAMVVLDTLKMDKVITVHKGVNGAGSSVDLVPGEKLTVEQLLYAMMLESGNDAAEELGLAAAGSQKEFSKMMNAKAKECGAQNTDYKNPNGLNEDANALNVTTAYDQAVITKEAMKNKKFRKIVSTSKYTIPKTNKSKARKLKNSNACLWVEKQTVQIDGKNIPLKYTGCTGVKTGYTTSAGGCYVGAAKRGNMELVVAVFGSPDVYNRFADAIKLWDYGFENYKTYTAEKSDKAILEQKVRRGALAKLEVGLDEDFDITLDKDYKAKGNIKTEINLNEEKPTAPIKKGQVMGTIEAYNGEGNLIAVTELRALHKVEKGGPLSYIGIADEYLWIVYTILGLIIVLIIILMIMRTRRRPKKPQSRKRKVKKTKKSSKKKARPTSAQTQQTQQAPQTSRHIEPPLSETLRNTADHQDAIRSSRNVQPPLSQARQAAEQADPYGEARPQRSTRSRSQSSTRTRAEKKAARKQRARRRKARNRK